jgi:hypothetical protein
MKIEWLSNKLGRSLVLMGERGQAHYYWHFCPGCNGLHHYTVVLQEPWDRPQWKSSGTYEKPSFTPSMLITWGRDVRSCCHYFLTDGQIQYQGDCTHTLKGQTVALPDVPEYTRQYYEKWDSGKE